MAALGQLGGFQERIAGGQAGLAERLGGALGQSYTQEGQNLASAEAAAQAARASSAQQYGKNASDVYAEAGGRDYLGRMHSAKTLADLASSYGNNNATLDWTKSAAEAQQEVNNASARMANNNAAAGNVMTGLGTLAKLATAPVTGGGSLFGNGVSKLFG